jgi:SAM-dependent methyltransferase
MKVFYEELAPWWPLISPATDYEEEATETLEVIARHAPGARTALELGSGGGNMAFYLKRCLTLTLTDLSAAMLDSSRRLNPELEHVCGDMRTLALDRRFDLVFAHDAIDYMRTESDLAAVFRTAHRHLVPGGVALFLPDHVRERFEPGTESGGADGDDGRSVRFLEWTPAVADDATAAATHYAFVVRDAAGDVRHLHERHEFGLFPEATWVRLLGDAGFAVDALDEQTSEDRTPRLLFIGRKIGE